MEAVWPLTALYAGPAAVAAYIRWGRPMSPRWMKQPGHGMRGKPFWAGTAVSATHCGAGCVLGDLVAEWTVFAAALQLAGLALPVEYPFDYARPQLGDLVPVLRHRAHAPPGGRRGAQARGQADFLALSAFEIGLFGWMAIMQLVLFPSPHLPADSAAFWFLMQVGMLIGFATTYPMNWWLIRHGIKEVM